MNAPDTDPVGAISLLDEPVRRRLYEWASSQTDAVGRDDAANAVGISRALAAFHLDRLAAAGLLDTEFRRLSGRSGPGAGRPAKLYRRSHRDVEVSLPDRRYGFAAELFARALDEGNGDSTALAAVAHDAGVALGRKQRGRSRKTQTLTVLANGGYEPVADADGTIRLRNCPFHALAATHRQLTCGMNLSLAEGMLEGLGGAGLVAELDTQPGWCCVVFRKDDGATDDGQASP
jgi:predicted ArsR family transcriptional regulator